MQDQEDVKSAWSVLRLRANSQAESIHKLEAALADAQQQLYLATARSDPHPKSVCHQQHTAQPVHDGTACSQQIEAALKQLRGEVTGNAEQDHSLLSHLRQAQVSVADSKASNLAGTPSPMAVLSSVQDTQGNSLLQEKTVGLHRSLLPQPKRLKTGSSYTASEQEEQALSEPAPAMQADALTKAASAAKENSPAAAIAQTAAQGTGQPTTLDPVLHASKLAALCARVISCPKMYTYYQPWEWQVSSACSLYSGTAVIAKATWRALLCTLQHA